MAEFQSLLRIISTAHQSNKKFQAAFDDFFALCRTALNPNISRTAVFFGRTTRGG